MKTKYVICLAMCLALVSCAPERRPTDTGSANPDQEQGIAPSAAGPTALPTPVVPKQAAAQSKKYEKQADRIHDKLARTTDPALTLELAGKAIDMYKKAIDLDSTNDRLVHKYIRTIELKYNLIIPDGEREDEKKKVYADALALLERLHPADSGSIYAQSDTALLLILNNVYYIIFQSIGAVNRTYGICEKIYAEDKTFEDYSAATVLGRLNFLAPNIPFIMGWPDKNRSRQYLEEALAANPHSLIIKFFLADTLYALNEKDKALGYFHEAVSEEPRKGIDYFQDKKIQRNCGIRMKELGVN